MGKKIEPVYVFYLEKFIEFSDKDNKSITNQRAKEILGRYFHLPDWLQVMTLNRMRKLKLVESNGRKELEIKSVSLE